MIIEIIPCLSDNYSYVIYEKETNTISIVDPSEFNTCDKVINKYKKLDYILSNNIGFGGQNICLVFKQAEVK